MGPLLFVLLALPAAAGGLGRFEGELKKAAPKKEPRNTTRTTDSTSGSGCDVFPLCLFLDLASATSGATLEYASARPRGLALIPRLRLDAAYQRVYSNIDAFSGRAELGHGPFGVAYERIEFREHDPPDRLSGWRGEALWRLAPGEGARVDGAAGFMGFRREGSHSGTSVGLSVGLYPRRAYGFEMDLRWGSIGDATVTDWRGRLLISPRSWRGFGLRPGYRGIRTGDSTLHGPELTLSYTW